MEGGKTIRQLKKEAMNLKIKGYYNMRKAELVEAISKRKMELAKTAQELKSMKIHQLRSFAKRLGLKLSRGNTKNDLINMISEVLSTWKNGKKETKRVVNISSVNSTPSQVIHKEAKGIFSQADLPKSYNKDKLVGLEVNPAWVYFYWDFSKKTEELLKKHAPLILRVYDVTYVNFNGANAHRTFELELDVNERKYYVNVPSPDANYIAELGYKEGERFIALIRSNLISTPPASPKISQMEVWMNLKTRQKFSEISVSKEMIHVEKLIGASSFSPSKVVSGGGSFIWMRVGGQE
ncbi:DUF4912 domain-containing protein [Mesoaciditoga sp.]